MGRQHTPTLKEHPRSGSSYGYFNGKQIWFGSYKDPQTKRDFARFLFEWEENGRQLRQAPVEKQKPIVDDLIAGFIEWGEKHYRRKDKSPTGELSNYIEAARHLSRYRTLPTDDFDLLKLERVRQSMIDRGLARTTINPRVARIIRMFRWGARRGLVTPATLGGLLLLEPLEAGRSDARETDGVKPVAWKDIEATLPYLSDAIAALVRFQWATGCRPGEALQVRLVDIDKSGSTWLFRPINHKLARSKVRTIPLGPEARRIIEEECMRTWPPPAPDQPLFDPRERATSTTRAHKPRQWPARDAQTIATDEPSNSARVAATRAQEAPVPVAHFTVTAYRSRIYRGVEALARARKRAGDDTPVVHWHPNQIRHSHATRITAAEGDMNAARVILGHTNLSTTERYAERDLSEAIKIAERHG